MARNVEPVKDEQAKSLIKFYNTQIKDKGVVGVSVRNVEIATSCINRANGDIVLIKNHIRKWVRDHALSSTLDDRYEECLEAIELPKPEQTSFENSLAIISNTVASIVAKTEAKRIEDEIMSSVQDEVRNFIYNEYGPIERKVNTIVNGVARELKGLQHEKFETVLKFVANDEPVFLTGPAGSGKNYICKQVAEALGLNFYFSNAVTQEYKLTGFTDAMGNYQPTQFYKAFTEGGVFMLDEMDASIPEVLVILNAAIANRYFDFPAPIGYKEAHPDFRVVAAGNTTGHGADYEYVGRNQLDGASLDRFAIVDIDYSVTIENGLAVDTAVADFCREFRNASKKVGVGIIVSYRAIGRLAKMSQILNLDEALKTCLVKDLDKDDLNMIIKELQSSKYKTSLQNIWAVM